MFYFDNDPCFLICARSYFFPSRSHFLRVRIPEVEIMTVTIRPVAGFRSRFFCKFGFSFRFVRRLDFDTLYPVRVFLPVIMQDFDIGVSLMRRNYNNFDFFCLVWLVKKKMRLFRRTTSERQAETGERLALPHQALRR